MTSGQVAARRSREAVRRRDGGRRDQPRHAIGRVLLAPRPVRLRQDHHVAADRGVRTPGRGPDPARRRGHGADAAAQAQRQHGLPELRPVPAPHGRRERRVRAPLPGRLEAGSEDEGGRRARAGPAPGPRASAPLAALGRPAAAGGAREGADPEPGGAPARRAAGRARRQAPQGAADRAEGAPGGDRHHVHLRDPRPGGSAHDVGPARGDEQRSGGADRLALGRLRGAGAPRTSPTSWASRT